MKIRGMGVLVLALFLQCIAFGQEKWWVALRPNMDASTKQVGEADLRTGLGFETALGYQFMPHLGGYIGWGYNAFNTTGSPFGGIGNTDFNETGYTFGLQFIHPLGVWENFSYLIRVGGIYNHIEVKTEGGAITADSGHGLGWEVGAGIQLDMGNNWNLRPQLGYRALASTIHMGTVTRDVDLNYISIGMGIAKAF